MVLHYTDIYLGCNYTVCHCVDMLLGMYCPGDYAENYNKYINYRQIKSVQMLSSFVGFQSSEVKCQSNQKNIQSKQSYENKIMGVRISLWKIKCFFFFCRMYWVDDVVLVVPIADCLEIYCIQ